MRQPPPDLLAEWRRRLREAGHHDIEAPSGMIASESFEGDRGQYFSALAAVPVRVVGPGWRVDAWRLVCAGGSHRDVARSLQVSRHAVDRLIRRLEEYAAGQRRPRGRPPLAESIGWRVSLRVRACLRDYHAERLLEHCRRTGETVAHVVREGVARYLREARK